MKKFWQLLLVHSAVVAVVFLVLGASVSLYAQSSIAPGKAVSKAADTATTKSACSEQWTWNGGQSYPQRVLTCPDQVKSQPPAPETKAAQPTSGTTYVEEWVWHGGQSYPERRLVAVPVAPHDNNGAQQASAQ